MPVIMRLRRSLSVSSPTYSLRSFLEVGGSTSNYAEPALEEGDAHHQPEREDEPDAQGVQLAARREPRHCAL